MLRRYFIVISLVCMGLVSCEDKVQGENQDNPSQEPTVEENIVTSIQASFLQNSTKAEMFENGTGPMKYYWNNYDAIELMTSSTTEKYLYKGTDKVRVAEFKGESIDIGAGVFAVYGGKNLELSEGGITFELPSEYTFSNARMALAPMCAYGKKTSLDFVDCCGYIGLEVKGDAKIKSLSITPVSTNESLSGSIYISVADDVMDIENAPEFKDRAVTMKMSQPLLLNSNSTIKIVIPVLTGSFSKGVELTFTDDAQNKTTFVAEDPAEVSKGKITWLEDIYTVSADMSDELIEDTTPDPIRTFDYSILRKTPHPRLLMTDTHLEQWKEKCSVNGSSYGKIHDYIIGRANTYLISYMAPLQYAVTGGRLLSVSRDALSRIWFCAYAWRMTGEKKYLDYVEKTMTEVCEFPDWHTDHFLDTGEMALGVAIGYDWCHSGLSSRTKAKAINRLRDFAITQAPGKSFQNSKSNWNQVCYGGLVAASIAIYDKEVTCASDMIEEAIASNKRAVEAMYAPDGNYPEGYSYWSYGTSYQVILLSLLNEVFGNDGGIVDNVPGFAKTGDYILYMTGTTGECFNYSDCKSYEFPHYAMWWFANEYSRPELLANELKMIDKYTSKSDELRLLPMIPCMTSQLPQTLNITYPREKIWHGGGATPVILVHTDWTFSETDKYLGFKGGNASYSHAHMDAGSFVYDAYGVRWSSDLQRQEYSYLEPLLEAQGGELFDMTQNSLRWDVYRLGNLSHSTLTINDAKHRVNGRGVIESVINSGNELGGTMDLSAVFADQAESVKRTIILSGEDLYITDVIKAQKDREAKIDWRMLTQTNVALESDAIRLSSGAHTMYLVATASDASVSPNYFTQPAEGTRSWDQANSGFSVVGYSVTVPKNATMTLTTKLSKTK